VADLSARRLDALLIGVGSPHPAAARVAAVAGIPPLGLAYLAAVLRGRGMRVRVADLNIPGWSRERLARCLAVQRPAVVGISCMTESFRNAVRLGAWIRRTDPGARIVVGGPHVTFQDRAALRTGAFEVVVRGEGERTAEELFPILASGARLHAGIRGISFLEGSTLVRAPERERVKDLDALPWPARDLLAMERYGAPGAILTGRGCPGRCLFCSASAMAGGAQRTRGEEPVLEEILFLHGLGIRDIVFLDDTLTGDRQRLERLLDRIDRSGVRFAWSCESRIESVDRALLRRMARLGCHAIQYGIESGSDSSQRRLGKGIHTAGVEGVLRATDRAGIRPVCSFILGLPWEGEEDIRRTVEFGLRLQRRFLATIGFGLLVCYPGTQFWKRGAAFGLERMTRDFDRYTMHIPTCRTPHFALEELRRLHFEATLRQLSEMPRAMLELNPTGEMMVRLLERARAGA
jgi:anaerobic magnesium-protoporphyrin IX monomethyl ester cyclase